MKRVGIRMLRQQASAVLRRVAAGERVEVTDRGRPIAVIVPIRPGDVLERLEAEGRLIRAHGDLLALGPPLQVKRGTRASVRLARARAHER